MDHLADTNVLIRSIDRSHAMRSDAAGALSTLLGSGNRVCVTSQNIIEFWNFGSLPRASIITENRETSLAAYRPGAAIPARLEPESPGPAFRACLRSPEKVLELMPPVPG
jgi:predicted nucleic acid-binding protein